MANFRLFIAQTLDGYIARPDGKLDWLDQLPVPEGEDYGYGEFYEGIDTIVMGRTTYEEVLGFGVEWPYADCQVFVLTSNEDFQPSTPNTQVLAELDADTIDILRTTSMQGIWIVGGGQVIRSFLNLDAVDEMVLTIVPVILGAGIPLFPAVSQETWFELDRVDSFETGVVNLYYQRKDSAE
ncbi:dihydrofolate reductase family protein [Pontibacter sp. G13]|uniref:dihydrofolate reductase family protein n=1 Tax=Pontibacter sp. G13 TaxID=3074898 RepID=UPI00288AF51F|nr:dihydrofolate reductase family protein [Pontibacter sp. G13]WNJ17819.1 dihydrofolate reductase family protein [Pontibacter sp. G13]